MSYSFSTDQENFQGHFATREEAVEEAFAEMSEQGYENGHVWTARNVTPARVVDAELLIEWVSESTTDEAGEWASGYLSNIPKTAIAELETNLQALWNRWEAKYALQPEWFNADYILEHKKGENDL